VSKVEDMKKALDITGIMILGADSVTLGYRYAVNHTFLVVNISQIEHRLELRNVFVDNVRRVNHAAYIRDDLNNGYHQTINSVQCHCTIALRDQ